MALTQSWDLSQWGITLPNAYIRVGFASLHRTDSAYTLSAVMWVYQSQQAAQSGKSPVDQVQLQIDPSSPQVQQLINSLVAGLYQLARTDPRFTRAVDVT
jgi:hypothetical protein